MKNNTTASLLTVLALASILNPSARNLAQGSLTPPGAPAPTMKTLDQIEPRTPINATTTPGSAGVQHNISAPGSYYLTGNLAVTASTGITVSAADVTIDLNGFRIFRSSGSGGVAITIDTGGNGCVVKNGSISGFTIGTSIASGPLTRGGSFLQLVVSGCTSLGLRAPDGWRIDGCQAFGNGDGIITTGSTITNCTVSNNTNRGIVSAMGSTGNTLANCTVLQNGSNGIDAGPGSTLINCTANSNAGNGIVASDGSTLTNCTAKNNSGTYGIFAGEGSTLTGCTAYSNNVEFGIRADDRSTLTNCTVALNTSAATDSWGISAGAQCTITQCSVSGNLNTNGTPTDSTGGGILAGGSSTVQNCTVVGNKGDGIQIVNDARVVGNNCDSNSFGGGNAAGIHSTGADNRIEANNVTDNTRGIDVDSTGSLIIKNSASGNTSNYEIAASNSVGAIIVPAASPAISGNAAVASSLGSTDPWANFSY